jgi:hypothetical protein
LWELVLYHVTTPERHRENHLHRGINTQKVALSLSCVPWKMSLVNEGFRGVRQGLAGQQRGIRAILSANGSSCMKGAIQEHITAGYSRTAYSQSPSSMSSRLLSCKQEPNISEQQNARFRLVAATYLRTFLQTTPNCETGTL